MRGATRCMGVAPYKDDADGAASCRRRRVFYAGGSRAGAQIGHLALEPGDALVHRGQRVLARMRRALRWRSRVGPQRRGRRLPLRACALRLAHSWLLGLGDALQQLRVALLFLARAAREALGEPALDEARQRRVDVLKVSEGVHALGALLELARSLR